MSAATPGAFPPANSHSPQATLLSWCIATWWVRGLLLGIVVASASLLGFMNWSERWGLTALLTVRGDEPLQTPLVLISIDEDSFDELNLPWPWPRAFHAQLLDRIRAGQPAVIGIDIAFPEPSLHGPEDDRTFADAITRAGNVVLASAVTVFQDPSYRKENFNAPINPLRERARSFGFVNLLQDTDAVVRSMEVSRTFQDRVFPSFPMAVAQEAARNGVVSRFNTPSSSTILINYRTTSLAAHTVPYYRVLQGDVPPELFTGKIVLIGSTSPLLHGTYATSRGRAGMAGVEIEAHAVETLLQHISPERVPYLYTLFLVLAAAVLSVRVTGRLHPLMAAGLLATAAGAYALIAVALFVWQRSVLDLPIVPVTLLSGYAVTIMGNIVYEQRQRAYLMQLFSRHVSPEIAEAMWRERDQLLAGGRLQSQKLIETVLFTDLRGFTTLSEGMETKALMNWVSEYMESMARLVTAHGGVVEDYFGDAIKADFGAPLARTTEHEIRSDAIHAVECALAMGDALHALNRLWRDRGLPTVDMRVGICTGEVVAGCVGSHQRLKFTTMGDVVNTAARLESYEKDSDDPSLNPGSCRILIAESTASYLPPRFWMHRVGTLSLRGRTHTIDVHRVYGQHGTGSSTEPGTEARKSDRIDWSIPITLLHPVHCPTRTYNLSVGGLAICRLSIALPVGTMSTLRFEIPGHRHPIQASAMVVWVQGERVGVAFASLPTADQLLLEQFLQLQASRKNI